MVTVKMTLSIEEYQKFLKAQHMQPKPKQGISYKGSKYELPDILKNCEYPINYHCGICDSNLFLRHPAHYHQHVKTKKHTKKMGGVIV